MAGLEGEGAVMAIQGFAVASESLKSEATVVVAFGVLRLDGERPLVRAQGADMSAKVSQHGAIVDVRDRVIRCMGGRSREQPCGLFAAT